VGQSEWKEDFWGNKYLEHPDGSRSEVKEDFFGNRYLKHSDGSRSDYKEGLFGDKYLKHEDGSRSEFKENFWGEKYIQHSDGSRSWSKKGFWGNKYLSDTAGSPLTGRANAGDEQVFTSGSGSKSGGGGFGAGLLGILFLVLVGASLSKNSNSPNPSGRPTTPPRPTPAIMRITASGMASSVDAGGRVISPSLIFRGTQKSLSSYIEYTGANPKNDGVVMVLKGAARDEECGPLIFEYQAGTVWCEWANVMPGSYRVIVVRMSGPEHIINFDVSSQNAADDSPKQTVGPPLNILPN
jgi:hypothetical protein